MNNSKWINLLLILTSLIGYLEWGGGNSTFLIMAEAEVLSRLPGDTEAVAHPFVLIPLAGQILLLITLFQKRPRGMLTYMGMACIGILMAFMFLIGILGLNYKIVLSTLPFLLLAIFRTARRSRFKES